eukprot:TRINITY_DN50536_c0_g1_i1.p1 TRINITY_DN50536_c0_g1~~TRINITY_DN50536_c0_g1_i1.p1  ORF type:complete len:195 (+),score=63.51 TRINITY_DN50536_c0_g1_i1:105-689(+)
MLRSLVGSEMCIRDSSYSVEEMLELKGVAFGLVKTTGWISVGGHDYIPLNIAPVIQKAILKQKEREEDHAAKLIVVEQLAKKAAEDKKPNAWGTAQSTSSSTPAPASASAAPAKASSAKKSPVPTTTTTATTPIPVASGAWAAAASGRKVAPATPAPCLLYTSDAADEEDSVDLGGRRIITKNMKDNQSVYKQL